MIPDENDRNPDNHDHALHNKIRDECQVDEEDADDQITMISILPHIHPSHYDSDDPGHDDRDDLGHDDPDDHDDDCGDDKSEAETYVRWRKEMPDSTFFH